jgi:hypothetical protein
VEAAVPEKRSAERAAANEVTFRQANEELRRRRDALGLDGTTPFLCECEEESCTTLLHLTAQEYGEARAEASRFVLAPDHPFTNGTVVAENERFILVDKDLPLPGPIAKADT